MDFASGPNLGNIIISPVGGGNDLTIGFRDTNVGDRNLTIPGLVENNKWMHFAVVFEGRRTDQTLLKVYKDGVLRGSPV